jgi:DNA modification methylase
VSVHNISELKLDPKNARKHSPQNMRVIEESLQKNGFGRSILLAADGTVLAGNATLEAAGSVGIEDVIIVESDGTKIIAIKRTDLDPDDEQAVGLAISDNSAATYASWDTERLAALIEEGHNISGYFDHDELKKLVRSAKPDKKLDDIILDAEIISTVKAGDVYLCGNSYVMCGDSTSLHDVDTLFDISGCGQAALLVTSPPYGVGKNYDASEREDSLQDWRELMLRWIGEWADRARVHAINLADLRVGPDNREVHTYGEIVSMCEENKIPLIATRIWVKPPAWNQPYYAHSYRPVDDFEYIGLFGDKAYKSRLGAEYDWRYRGTWDMASVASNSDHPAKFPIELPTRCILLLTDENEYVCDPFLGSGTSLVAAHTLGRRGVFMEQSPRYVDLSLARWSQLTGDTPVLVSRSAE